MDTCDSCTALRQQLAALRDKWRAKAAAIDSTHATMGTGWKVCADELDALLAPQGSAPTDRT